LPEFHEALLAVATQQSLFGADWTGAFVIRHGARVPHQHAARMDDEKRCDRQRHFLHVGVGESVTRRLGGQHAAVEHVDAWRGDWAAIVLCVGCRPRDHGDRESGECAPESDA